MPEKLLSPAQVAEALGLNVGDVGRLISAGRLPAKRLIGTRGTGKRPRLRVLQSALMAYIEAMPDAVGEVPVREPRPRKRATPIELIPTTKYY